jgi:predicted permease
MTRRLSKEQRDSLAGKLMDWGNLVFTGLVIAQFAPGATSFQWFFIFTGSLVMVIAYISGILLMKTKGGEKE